MAPLIAMSVRHVCHSNRSCLRCWKAVNASLSASLHNAAWVARASDRGAGWQAREGNMALDSSEQDFEPPVLDAAWPADGLERVAACPVCQCAERDVLHAGLSDRVFGCAPGKWTLQICRGCRSAYLDPRPTPDTLAMAYRSYYTHGSAGEAAAPGAFQSWIRAGANGYRNAYLGLDRTPSSSMGGMLIACLPWVGDFLRAEVRHLGAPEPGRDRLLDVGCGNGRFLQTARELGWRVRGIDIDANAVATARARGLEVSVGQLDELVDAGERFDVVTSSHVIEHVYHPGDFLKSCCEVLNKEGRLWLETPNIESFGHERFGPHWRDLDAPRHLVLFNRAALTGLLSDAGFDRISFVPRAGAVLNTFPVSRDVARDAVPAAHAKTSQLRRLADAVLDAYHFYFAQAKTEFLTVSAVKRS